MDSKQIKYMVNRFLSWKLPENFRPDGGISFKRMFNEDTPHPMKHEPSGTNLLHFTQAEAMVRHLLEGLPETSADEDGGPAFPSLVEYSSDGYPSQNSNGLSLRDYFAGQVLAGSCSHTTGWDTLTQMAQVSYELADAMIAARKGEA
jgi:hypothetical protein